MIDNRLAKLIYILLITVNYSLSKPYSSSQTDHQMSALNDTKLLNNNHDFNNDSTLHDGETLYDVPWYIIAILTLLYGTISVLAVLGNGLIVWVVLRNKRMHNVTNYFISNLAMADIVIGVFATPFQFQAALLQYWALPKIMCKVAPFATTLSVNVSIFTLVAISLDRYYVILYPLKPKLRVKQCFIILLLIWIIALILSSLHLHNYYVIDNKENDLPRCDLINYTVYKYHVLFLVLVQYVLPFIIISFTYFLIGYHIYFDSSPDTVNKNQEQNKRKVLKMIFIVVSLFMFCWFPLQLYNFLQFIKPSINAYKYINILWFCANWLAMSNSSYNVFIYGICSARYKREFRKVLSCFPCIDDIAPEYNIVNMERRQGTWNKTQKSNSSMRMNNNNNDYNRSKITQTTLLERNNSHNLTIKNKSKKNFNNNKSNNDNNNNNNTSMNKNNNNKNNKKLFSRNYNTRNTTTKIEQSISFNELNSTSSININKKNLNDIEFQHNNNNSNNNTNNNNNNNNNNNADTIFKNGNIEKNSC